MIAVGGEALIDLVLNEGVEHPYPGGGPFNTAVALGGLGAPVAFVGGISSDRYGRLLEKRLRETGVDLGHVVRSALPTPVALVSTGADGQATYNFALDGTAYTDVGSSGNPSLGADITALHLGTLALAVDPPAGAYEALMHDRGDVTVMIDPNVRPAIFGDPTRYRHRFEGWLERADIVKLSGDDASWIYPGVPFDEVVDHLLHAGVSLVALTLGGGGTVGATRAGKASFAGYEVDVVDTVGAGDAFGAGLLHWLWATSRLGRANVAALEVDELGAVLAAGAGLAALVCTRAGAGAFTFGEVQRFVASFEGSDTVDPAGRG